jgi:hypothetical protein
MNGDGIRLHPWFEIDLLPRKHYHVKMSNTWERSLVMKIPLRTLLLALVIFGITAMAEADPSSKPKFSAPSASKPSHKPDTSSKPSTTPSHKPKFSTPPSVPHGNHDKGKDKDSKPKFTTPSTPVGSAKPTTSGHTSSKAQAAREARSEAKFVESKKAVAPPKPKYTSPEGKEVHVRTGSKDVEYIRNLPSTSIKPEVRRENITVHVTQHYHHPYTYYASQPVVYVGGGYSSTFWWMMMEWDAERRARWFYNHRYDIESDAYARGVRDAQVSGYINKWEAQRVARDAAYIDTEFRKDPSLQYTDDYVQAAYNPVVVKSDPVSLGGTLKVFLILLSIILGMVILWGIYYVIFVHRW